MPVIQASTDLLTYSDCVQYVCDAHAVDRTGLNERHARSAVRYAYRELPARHTWNYYYRQRILQTVAEYATGTVEFDYTGGSSERLITLTSGTFPYWAAYGRIIIDDVHYEVETNPSSTTLTLSETSNPGADVASGTSYTLYRSSYPLPANFGTMTGLWDVDQQCSIGFIDQRTQHFSVASFYDTPDTPLQATIRATGKYLGGLEIVFGPPPSAINTYDMLYIARPRALAIDEYSNGTVAINAGSASVAGTSTTFPATCVGSIIRFSDGPVKPSGYTGSIDGADNPFVYQGVIKTRTSATALVLEEAMPSTLSSLSGVAYTISDPLDIEPHRMLTVFQKMAEAEFSRLTARQDAPQKAALARQALREAMEDDTLVENSQTPRISDSIRRSSVTNSA